MELQFLYQQDYNTVTMTVHSEEHHKTLLQINVQSMCTFLKQGNTLAIIYSMDLIDEETLSVAILI